MSLRERMLSRLHEPLSREPQPVISTLIAALARGLEAIDVRAAQRSLYLQTARGRWLDVWADLYSYSRERRSDSELRGVMTAQTILKRRATTLPLLAEAVEAVCGKTPLIRLGRERVYRFDHTELLLEGQRAFGYSVLDESGEEVGDYAPFTHAGSALRLPQSPGFGPSGIWITLPMAYDPLIEAAVLKVLERRVKAGGGFQLGWAVTVSRELIDQITVDDAVTMTPMGWGVDEWGGSTWG